MLTDGAFPTKHEAERRRGTRRLIRLDVSTPLAVIARGNAHGGHSVRVGHTLSESV